VKFCWCGTGNAPVWVSSGSQRLFLAGYLGNPETPGPVGVFWSDDGATWTRAKGNFAGLPSLDFAAGGILAQASVGEAGAEQWLTSTDKGASWVAVKGLTPVGIKGCNGTCTGSGVPDGIIYSDGHRILAVKNNGQGWTSLDAVHWSPLSWGNRSLKTSDPAQSEVYHLKLLPGGVFVDGSLGSAS
jgi:hypothetical protein